MSTSDEVFTLKRKEMEPRKRGRKRLGNRKRYRTVMLRFNDTEYERPDRPEHQPIGQIGPLQESEKPEQ